MPFRHQSHTLLIHSHLKIMPYSIRCNNLFIIASYILMVNTLLIISCSTPQPLPAIQDLIRPTYTEDEIQDISMTIILLNAGRRRALLRSEDAVSWITDYWKRIDPSPGTSENEALEVFRQRAKYLNNIFPDIPLNEVPEPWTSFLRNGHWDWIQSGYLPITLRYIDVERSTPESIAYKDSMLLATDVLVYNSPEPFKVVIYENDVIYGTTDPKTPSLRRDWETLENPRSSSRRKESALRRITWFETKSFAQKLLDIPKSSLENLGSTLDVYLRRMSIRRSYCLGVDGSRRLAAITAAGAPPRLQLTRTISDEYSTEQYLADLDAILEKQPDKYSPRSNRPHPALRFRPEEFIIELAERFSTTKSVTGWDWRGDLYLSHGPPLHYSVDQRIAYYAYGYPVTLRIRSGVLGAVDKVYSADYFQSYIDNNYQEIWGRRAQARIIVEDLKSIIPKASRSTQSLLGQLHKLLPVESRIVGPPYQYISFNITADVIAFQDSSGSFDILASLGVPYDEIGLSGPGHYLKTNLETTCLLLRATLQPLWNERHGEGFFVERSIGTQKYLFLVDTFRHVFDPGNYLLYCSALDPDTEKSGGVILPLDIRSEETHGLHISQIALAGTVSATEERGSFIRGNHRIIPYPGRNLLYGEDIWLYYEITGLDRSDLGDYAWEESYFIIPDQPGQGIVRIIPGLIQSRLQSDVERSFMIDLSVMESVYEGPFFIIILITDVVSGQIDISVTQFNIYRR